MTSSPSEEGHCGILPQKNRSVLSNMKDDLVTLRRGGFLLMTSLGNKIAALKAFFKAQPVVDLSSRWSRSAGGEQGLE